MNYQPATAPQRNATRHAADDGGARPQQEIKYRQDAAGYITSMIAELRQIAGKAGFEKLMKTLDAAYYEAYAALDAHARETAPAPRGNAPAAGLEKTLQSMEPNAT